MLKTSLSANSTHKPSPPLHCTSKTIIFTLVFIYKHPEINMLDNKSCQLTVHDISQLKTPFCLLDCHWASVLLSSVRAGNQERCWPITARPLSAYPAPTRLQRACNWPIIARREKQPRPHSSGAPLTRRDAVQSQHAISLEDPPTRLRPTLNSFDKLT